MKLNDLANNPGAHKRKLKVGRGSSSGLGKTCGRGVKGAKARTGTKVYGFEGGQMPLYMRLPKRGFRNIFANDFSEIRLDRIQKAIDLNKLEAAGKITEEALIKAGLARKSRHGIPPGWKGYLGKAGNRGCFQFAGCCAGDCERRRLPQHHFCEARSYGQARKAGQESPAPREICGEEGGARSLLAAGLSHGGGVAAM